MDGALRDEGSEGAAGAGRVEPARVWLRRGVASVVSGTTVVPILNYIAFGTLAREADFSLALLVLIVIGVWWVSGQVVLATGFAHNMMVAPTALSVTLAGIPLFPMVLSVIPLFGRARRRWFVVFLAHLTNNLPWAFAQSRLPDVPEPMRPYFFGGYTAALMTICVTTAVIAFETAARLPPTIAALLIFVLPLHLLLTLAGSARTATIWLAILVGLVIGPPIHRMAPDFALLISGLVGGTLTFVVSRAVRKRIGR
jgi:predicted branched-subunit amino acid permease